MARALAQQPAATTEAATEEAAPEAPSAAAAEEAAPEAPTPAATEAAPEAAPAAAPAAAPVAAPAAEVLPVAPRAPGAALAAAVGGGVLRYVTTVLPAQFSLWRWRCFPGKRHACDDRCPMTVSYDRFV